MLPVMSLSSMPYGSFDTSVRQRIISHSRCKSWRFAGRDCGRYRKELTSVRTTWDRDAIALGFPEQTELGQDGFKVVGAVGAMTLSEEGAQLVKVPAYKPP